MMAKENILEIPMDVAVKPFKGVRKPFWPRKGEQVNQIHEGYDYTLLLRRKVTLHQIPGFIDVISEDPEAIAQIFANPNNHQVDNPFGETYFRMVWGAETTSLRDAKLEDQPFILRLGFPVRTPAEYAKLLNTYFDVNLRKEKYMGAWNLSTPAVARRMQRLEEGKPIALNEKNLFNIKLPQIESPSEGDMDLADTDFRRITFVWLANDIVGFRRIEFTFHQFYDGNDEQLEVPPTPEEQLPKAQRELVIARV